MNLPFNFIGKLLGEHSLGISDSWYALRIDKMIQEYIESKYNFKVHSAYIAEVKRDLGLPMYDAPNAVEELKQEREHPILEKIEAIKDALKHFGVI
mgnify:CR=1 FL=1